MIKLKKINQKLFTKIESKDTIKEDYNPLSKDYNFYERGGLHMDKKILQEIKKGLNFKERIIVHINKKTFIKVFNNTRIDTINKLFK